MKILWVCNKLPSTVGRLCGKNNNPFGGWLDDLCERLATAEGFELYILFPDKNEYEGFEGNLSYFSFMEKSCNKRFSEIIELVSPDIVHIWGTEYSHAKTIIDVCEKLGKLDRCVIHIQGIISIIGKYHYTEGLPFSVINRWTFRNLIKSDNIKRRQKNFIKKGQLEIQALQKVKHIIGRTDFDRAFVEHFNPLAQYHFCNESLRASFYQNNWDIDKIEPFSIFASQCGYPIKGFHYLLEAMPEILAKFPETHIYTTGKNLLNLTFVDLIKETSYQKYLISLIKKYHLEDHVDFLGVLSEQQMCRRYLLANVFVSPSTIENSPASLGEAMILGCPTVASDVGGVKNMLEHGSEGFVYQSSAPYMLAYYVKKIFADRNLALSFSVKARCHAQKTHDREKNFANLLNIYKQISGI